MLGNKLGFLLNSPQARLCHAVHLAWPSIEFKKDALLLQIFIRKKKNSFPFILTLLIFSPFLKYLFLLHIFQLLDGTTRFLVSLDYLPNASQTSVHMNFGDFVKEQLIHEITVDLRFCSFTKSSGDDNAAVPRIALGVAQLLNI